MEYWKDNNLSAVLEYPFDFERYIEERLREIDDLDERKFARIVLLEGLGKVIRCTEAKYHDLERRVYDEFEVEENQFETITTIVKREHYDPTNETLFPVVPEDLEKGKLAEKYSSEKELYIGTVFLEADHKRTADFQAAGTFPGTIALKGVKTDVSFTVRTAIRYRNQTEQLYQAFQDNHIPWNTIHTGYLDQFFDVFLDIKEGGAGTALEAGTVTLKDAELNASDFEESVRYERIPLWNIDRIGFDSTDFLSPCINGIYYEHVFSLKDKDTGDGYLIQTNEDILEIRREPGEIIIKSMKKTFEGWKALRIVQRKTARSLDYTAPLLTNHKRDSFFKRLAEKTKVHLLTKTDLFRRIMELDIRDYIEVKEYEICDNSKDYPSEEGMNWFVRDELFPMESRKVLLLKFEEKTTGHYLNDSMMRFAISQLQLEISEYRCVGMLI